MLIDDRRDDRDEGLDDHDVDRLSDMEDSRPIYAAKGEPEVEGRGCGRGKVGCGRETQELTHWLPMPPHVA